MTIFNSKLLGSMEGKSYVKSMPFPDAKVHCK